MDIKKQRIRIKIIFVLFFIIFGIIFWFAGKPMVEFVSDPQVFRQWVNDNGIASRFAFIGMMALQIIVAIIPGEPLEIGAGYAFGFWEGTALCLAGALVGSTAVFLFVRKFGRRAIEVFFSPEKIDSVKFLQNSKKLNLLVFIIFFIPGTPKDILCYCIGLTKMKLSTWLAITASARIPSVVTSTMGGNALGMQNYTFAVIVLVATFAISVAGLLVYSKISKRSEG